MHYLKCNECGHFNEVKTEYLTLCGKCNKKLENNFSNWKKSNPEGLFDEYQRLICISNQDMQQLQQPAKKEKPKNLKYWIGFAAVFALFYAIGQLGGEKLVDLFRKPAFDKAMMTYAEEINKNCPFMIDNVTQLDNVMTYPNNMFQYNYTIISATKESIDIEALKNAIEPNIINNAKTNPEMKRIRDNKTTLKYNYKDKQGVFLFMITITPEQYQ